MNIWNKVDRGWRHLDCNAAVLKNIKLYEECLKHIDIKKVHKILDWGAGGGWLSQILPDREIHLVDIIESNLAEAKKNVLSVTSDVQTHCLGDSDSIQNLGRLRPALLLAFSVIYHFPSVAHWIEVSDAWNEMKPKYIVGRTFLTDGPTWQRPLEEYSKGVNYLRGVVLNKQDLLNTFCGYKLVCELRIDKDWQLHGAPADQYSYVFVLKNHLDLIV